MISREMVIETVTEELETADNEVLELIYNMLLSPSIFYSANDFFKEE